MRLKPGCPRAPRAAGGFTLLEAVIAAGLVLLTVTAVTLCVATVSRTGARLETRMDGDRAAWRVAERLRVLPFCADSYPRATVPIGDRASDLVAAVFPHADLASNTASARYTGAAADGEEPGRLLHHAVQRRRGAGEVRGALSRRSGRSGVGTGGPQRLGREVRFRATFGDAVGRARRSGWTAADQLRAVGSLEAADLRGDHGGPLMRRPTTLRRADGRRDGGFTLVELLVAAGIAAVVMTAAFAWLWNIAALAGEADDRAQAATLADAVVRAVATDVHGAVCAVEPPSGRDPSRSLALVHDHAAAAAEAILIVWDPARDVVWRNASGTYLSDHVTRCAVAYVLADGTLVEGRRMGPADWTSVRAVRVDLATAVGSAVALRSVEASVGPS